MTGDSSKRNRLNESELLAQLQKSFNEWRYEETLTPLSVNFETFIYFHVPEIPQQCLEETRVFSDRYKLIETLPKHLAVAEIGVALGDFSESLVMALKPKYFGAVDIFEGALDTFGLGEERSKQEKDRFQEESHFDFYNRRMKTLAARYNFELDIRKGLSWEQIGKLNKEIDVFYLDASHSFINVLKDVQQCLEKIAKDGFLIFNDYCWADLKNGHVYGVIPVVNSLCASGNWKVHSFAFENGMFCDICLQRL